MRPLEEIERDIAALPPGPWTTEDHAVETSSQDTPWTEVLDSNGCVVVDTSNSDHSVTEEDGKLHDAGAATCERIARLRGDATDLCEEVSRLRAGLQQTTAREQACRMMLQLSLRHVGASREPGAHELVVAIDAALTGPAEVTP